MGLRLPKGVGCSAGHCAPDLPTGVVILGVATVLVSRAAAGLFPLMAGAGITHNCRHETPNVIINLVLGILAAGVALPGSARTASERR